MSRVGHRRGEVVAVTVTPANPAIAMETSATFTTHADSSSDTATPPAGETGADTGNAAIVALKQSP